MAACAAATVPITKLPPAPPHRGLAYDDFVHPKGRYPVSADFRAHGEWVSPGISFADYSSMSTQQRKQSGERRLPTPDWAVDDNKLRAVLVRYLEYRADFKRQQPGTEAERLQRAQERINAKRPGKIEILDRLSCEYVALKNAGGDPARLRTLEIQIENIDTQLVNSEHIAAKILRLVFLYYRVGLDSVGVAMELGTWKPPSVRQTLWRLDRVWERMQNPYCRILGRQKKVVTVAVKTPTQLGCSFEAAQMSMERLKAVGINVDGFASYLHFCKLVGNPAPFSVETWRLLEPQCQPKGLPRHTLPYSATA